LPTRRKKTPKKRAGGGARAGIYPRLFRGTAKERFCRGKKKKQKGIASVGARGMGKIRHFAATWGGGGWEPEKPGKTQLGTGF